MKIETEERKQYYPACGGAAAMLLVCTLAGCVTINIYFPAAAAEKAADAIIDDVMQLKQGGAPVNVKPVPGESK